MSVLLLHIGRGKAGSSTIQNTVALNREALLAHGIALSARSGEHRGHAVDVFFGMQQAVEHRDGLANLRALLDDERHRHVFVTSEYLFTATAPAIERLKQAIGPHDVSIIAYLRAYPEWLRSLYVQGIRRGRRHVDFDAFYERAAKRASCRAPLSQWADAFGWERLRIRHLGGLTAGGLIDDLASVLGCVLRPEADQNTSPHWLEVELLRAINAEWPAQPAGDTAPAKSHLAPVWSIMREAIAEQAPPGAEYLTLAQHRRLSEAYLEDAAWLAGLTDAPMPPPLPERTAERPFLPTIAAAPGEFRETVARRLRRSLRLKEHPQTRDLVLAVLARHWERERDGAPTVEA
jgi:hypothetical protein